MKIAVYTCVTDNYDTNWDHGWESDKVDYFVFSNVNVNTKYNFKKIDLYNNDPTRTARNVKINPHRFLPEGYDYSIWLDGNIVLRRDIRQLVEDVMQNNSLCLLEHRGSPTTLSDEADVCGRLGKDDKQLMLDQINGYFNKGLPKDHKMFETGVIIRRHEDDKVKEVMDFWWNEVKMKSKRDQLSFIYSMWENSMLFSSMCSLNHPTTKQNFKFKISHR